MTTSPLHPMASPKMRAFVERKASEYGHDLSIPNEPMHLLCDPYLPLTIERVSETQIMVGFHFVQNGDVVPDPEYWFYVHPQTGDWYVTFVQYSFLPGRRFGRVDDSGNLVLYRDAAKGELPITQQETAADADAFAEEMARRPLTYSRTVKLPDHGYTF